MAEKRFRHVDAQALKDALTTREVRSSAKELWRQADSSGGRLTQGVVNAQRRLVEAVVMGDMYDTPPLKTIDASLEGIRSAATEEAPNV